MVVRAAGSWSVSSAPVASPIPSPRVATPREFCDGQHMRREIGIEVTPARRFRGTRCSATSEKSGSRSSQESTFQSPLPIRDFYELLGVPVQASSGEIRQAYRNLQKRHHPDIVGQEGHAMTLLLNEAYGTLMDERLRSTYDKAHSYTQNLKSARYRTFTNSPYSTWVGPDRPEAIFVDENVCVGCRECVHAASNTFVMDDSTGCAKVKAQWADPEPLVKLARDVCPVNCIHMVEREDLAALEYLIRPQPKASNGIYGGGWERPRNVFMAAKTMKRQMQEKGGRTGTSGVEETPAQRRARMEADLKIKMGPLWRLWSWASGSSPSERFSTTESPSPEWSWKGLFGRSSTSDVLILPLKDEDLKQTIRVAQEWALSFASSSELPLPMPFRPDLLPNGVQLSLITAQNGTLASVGSLLVTVETPDSETTALGVAPPSISGSYLRVRREGTTGTGALPGEGRIVKMLKRVVLGRDDYNNYRLPYL